MTDGPIAIRAAAVREIVEESLQLAQRIETRIRDLGPVAVHFPLNTFPVHRASDRLAELRNELQRMANAATKAQG